MIYFSTYMCFVNSKMNVPFRQAHFPRELGLICPREIASLFFLDVFGKLS